MPERTVKTGWYRFHQNNSYGIWIGPQNIHVEAIDLDHACRRAEEEAGVYFNGCRDGKDCSCCGDRWYRPYEEPTETPQNYDEEVTVSDGIENLILSLDKSE